MEPNRQNRKTLKNNPGAQAPTKPKTMKTLNPVTPITQSLYKNLIAGTRVKIELPDGHVVTRKIIEAKNKWTDQWQLTIEMSIQGQKPWELEAVEFWVQRNDKGRLVLIDRSNRCHGGQPLVFLCVIPQAGMILTEAERIEYLNHHKSDKVKVRYNSADMKVELWDTLGTDERFDVFIHQLGIGWVFVPWAMEISDFKGDYMPLYTSEYGVEFDFEYNNRITREFLRS